jgi:hypothetical protein
MLFNGYCKLCFRLHANLLCWVSPSFTICFGQHGHLQVCMILYFHMLEGICFAAFFLPFFTWSHSACFHLCFSLCCLFANRQTRTQGNNKNNEGNAFWICDPNLRRCCFLVLSKWFVRLTSRPQQCCFLLVRCKQYGIFNISNPYRYLLPVMGIVLFIYLFSPNKYDNQCAMH